MFTLQRLTVRFDKGNALVAVEFVDLQLEEFINLDN